MWMTLLKQAVDSSTVTQVALELDISRTALSLVLNDKYPAKTDKIAEKVLSVYGKVICPFLGEQITLQICKKHHSGSVPTSSPRAMKHWRACQACQYNMGEGK